MDNNNEIKELVSAFKGYRDLLTPIAQNLNEFSSSFNGMKKDIENLNSTFGGDIQGKLDKIYQDLSSQAEKSKSLAGEIDNFSSKTHDYLSAIDSVANALKNVEERLTLANSIEQKAEEQIAKLDTIIEEKKKNYDIKQLQKNLETYNVGVEKVSEYINKDVADTLKHSSEMIESINDRNESVFQSIVDEKSSINSLVEEYQKNNQLLKKLVEKNDVDEEYIFDILDKWAEDRKVKTKK
jgi:chromosome segregation ATPase